MRGRFEGAAISSDGTIRAAPASRLLATTAEPFGWSVAGDGQGNTYLGTGNNARIVKINRQGAASTFYQGTGVLVSALKADGAGNLYAGFSPSGDIMRFAPDGMRTRIFIGKSAAIWDLEWASDGALLAASGGASDGSSAIFRIANAATAVAATAATPAVVLARLPQQHVRSITMRGTDIFAATANDGVLYRINATNGSATALYQVAGTAAQPGEITSVVANESGVFFGTLASGTVWRWNEKNGVQPYYASPQTSIYALAAIGTTLYAATGDKGIVYQITPGENGGEARGARVLEPTQQQATSLAVVKPQNRAESLLVATSNNAAVYLIGEANRFAGSFTTAIFDAGNEVSWGALRVDGNAVWLARTGNTSEPDATWSAWRPVAVDIDGEKRIISPATRYLQMRAAISANDRISRIEVVYRANNGAPSVAWTAPVGGEFLKGKKTLAWSGKDPNNDALRYKLSISRDGKTWTPVALKDTSAATFELDTAPFADGTYRARIEASDAARNPDDPQRVEAISASFIIDNTAPTLANAVVTKQENGDWRIEATATDVTSPLASAEWRFAPAAKPDAKTEATKTETPADKAAKPAVTTAAVTTSAATTVTTTVTTTIAAPTPAPADASWNAMTALDRIFDSRRETVVAIVPASEIEAARARGTLKLEIRATDAADNSATLSPQLPG